MSTSGKHQMKRRGERPGVPYGFDLLLKNDDGAAFAARQVVLAGDGVVPAAVRDDVLLLVSELVTNALRHAGMGPDQLRRVELRRRSGSVRVTVVDDGNGFRHPERGRSGSGESGGWGLFLVDQIADRWEVVPTVTGTRVWFAIRLHE
jgi:two-component sensor histidine kinase